MNNFAISSILAGLLFSGGCIREAGNHELSSRETPDTLIMENIFPFQEKHCHGSSIVELPNRDLLVVWFQGSGERTADDVAIMGSRLNRKTGTWDAPFIMADVPDFPDINPVVFIDPEKRLWLVWYTVIAYQWESSVLKYRISDNYMQASGAPEWKWQDVIHVRPDSSAPEGIGRNDSFVMLLERKFAEYHNHLASEGQIAAEGVSGITEEAWQNAVKHYLDIARGMNLVSNGSDTDGNGNRVRTRLGYPLMRRIGWQTRNKAIYIGNRMLLPLYSDGFDFSLVAISDNFGESWEFSEPLVGAGAVQPALALCADGSIRAYMRDNGPPPQRLMMSSSTDKGKTWSLVTDSEIPNPGTAADICLLKSGNWAIVHNDIEEGRHRLSVWLSEDEGKSWPHRKVIVNGMPGSETRAHYPAIIQDAGGIIHISFTNQVAGKPGGPAVKNIAHAWLSEDFLLGL